MKAERAASRSGGVVQIRKVRRDGWTARKRAVFLGELAQTMNIAHAARTVGISLNSTYALRKRDPAFAAGWLDALSDAYAKVEALLVQRAILGLNTEALDTGDTTKLQGLSERGLLGLLSHHRASVREHRDAQFQSRNAGGRLIEDERSAREQLITKLDEMEARLRATDRGE